MDEPLLCASDSVGDLAPAPPSTPLGREEQACRFEVPGEMLVQGVELSWDCLEEGC